MVLAATHISSLCEADQDLVRLVLFESKVVHWIFVEDFLSSALALVRGILFVLLLELWVGQEGELGMLRT